MDKAKAWKTSLVDTMSAGDPPSPSPVICTPKTGDTVVAGNPLVRGTPTLLVQLVDGTTPVEKTEKSKDDAAPNPPPLLPSSSGNALVLSGKDKSTGTLGFSPETIISLGEVVSGKAVEKSKDVSKAVVNGSVLLI